MAGTHKDTAAALATMWQELLKTPLVRSEDNFLDLGGNSLRAGEMALRIRGELGIDVPLDVILSEETFASFSRVVAELAAKQA
jgi:phthiocerol/phenolphthiocerol synthesis type-I polyketide synthase E